MSNIAEGFERGTKQEFINYLYIAKGSAGEVRAQLYAAFDIGYLNIEMFKYLNGLVLDCSRLISSFTKSVKQSDVNGMQYKKEIKKDTWLEDLAAASGLMFAANGRVVEKPMTSDRMSDIIL